MNANYESLGSGIRLSGCAHAHTRLSHQLCRFQMEMHRDSYVCASVFYHKRRSNTTFAYDRMVRNERYKEFSAQKKRIINVIFFIFVFCWSSSSFSALFHLSKPKRERIAASCVLCCMRVCSANEQMNKISSLHITHTAPISHTLIRSVASYRIRLRMGLSPFGPTSFENFLNVENVIIYN